MASSAVRWAGSGRPHPQETLNGDGWSVSDCGPLWRFAVVDGLGHGPQAAHAAKVILRTLETSPLEDIDGTLQACHEAARSTRGAAVSIAVVDLDQRTLTFGGLGNVEGRLVTTAGQARLVSARGIVGAALRKSRPVSFELPESWLLLLHSDGVSARLTLEWTGEHLSKSQLQICADSLVEQWGRALDDATVLIAQPDEGD